MGDQSCHEDREFPKMQEDGWHMGTWQGKMEGCRGPQSMQQAQPMEAVCYHLEKSNRNRKANLGVLGISRNWKSLTPESFPPTHQLEEIYAMNDIPGLWHVVLFPAFLFSAAPACGMHWPLPDAGSCGLVSKVLVPTRINFPPKNPTAPTEHLPNVLGLFIPVVVM